jgi:hypothetical protein
MKDERREMKFFRLKVYPKSPLSLWERARVRAELPKVIVF